MSRKPIDALLDKVEFRCTICKAKAGECDCWEDALYFADEPPYHREGLPGLTLCGELPWTTIPEIGGKIRRIHAASTPREWLCKDGCYDDDEGIES